MKTLRRKRRKRPKKSLEKRLRIQDKERLPEEETEIKPEVILEEVRRTTNTKKKKKNREMKRTAGECDQRSKMH